MKTAITTDQEEVFQHFGKCSTFTVFDFVDGEIENRHIIDASGSGHSALALLLKENGVELLICGGIGQGARNALAANGIRVIAGTKGPINAVIDEFKRGILKDNPSLSCNHHHEDGHSCGEHDHNCH